MRHALLISVDGLSFDMFRRFRFQLPNLQRLARAGFWRPIASVFPSMTWSAHVSLVTGQYPRHHGVIGNRWVEESSLIRPYRDDDADSRRRAHAPSVLDLAAAKGWAVAALNWPATQGARDIRYNMPEVMYDERLPFNWLSPPLRRIIEKRKRRDFAGSLARPADFLTTFFGRVTAAEGVETDMLVRDIVRWIVEPPQPRWLRGDPPRCTPHRGRCVTQARDPPRLLLVHLLAPDSWMHSYGTNPWVVRWSLEQTDAAIGAILRAYARAGILAQTALFVVSDHGFLEIRETMNLAEALRNARISGYRVALNGHAAFLYPTVSKAPEERAVAIALRSDRYNSCIEAVYAPAAYAALGLPVPPREGKAPTALGEHAGAPALVVLSRPHCIFRSRGPVWGKLGSRRIGFHGYLPSHPALQALLLGKGPGIRIRGRRPAARLVDVAPTIAHLMGLSWPARWPRFSGVRFSLDGRPLDDILAARAPRQARHRRAR